MSGTRPGAGYTDRPLCVCHLVGTLKSLVTRTKKRELEEVCLGRRAISVSVMAARADSLVALAGAYAGVDALAERLAFAHAWIPKMVFGYVLVREGDEQRIVYPPIQDHLDAIQQALKAAKVTPQGKSIAALSPDDMRWVTLQASSPAYYVYRC